MQRDALRVLRRLDVDAVRGGRPGRRARVGRVAVLRAQALEQLADFARLAVYQNLQAHAHPMNIESNTNRCVDVLNNF